MDFAVVSANGKIVSSKPFVAVAVDAASRLYPVRDSLLRRDIDKPKRDAAEAAIAAALREIALEAARR